jgi:hypothetical protein
MEPLTQPRGAPDRLSDSLHHNLNMYALAASAAGVSLLALAQPSEAKIVYTKTQQVIGSNGIYPLDLNQDGVVDFVIQQYDSGAEYPRLLAKGAFGNAIEGKKRFAAALKKGEAIGPRQRFVSSSGPAGEIMAGYYCSEGGGCLWSGQWANVTNHYLGLRFQIHRKTHYGWARVSTQTRGSQITATLTGYAYETIAHKAIRAGQTNGAHDATAPDVDFTESAVPDIAAAADEPPPRTAQPASLGRLALGARSVAPWRWP